LKTLNSEALNKLLEINFPFTQAALYSSHVKEEELKKWMVRFNELKTFIEKNGSIENIYSQNYSLYSWCKSQKDRYKKGILSDERIHSLKSIDFDFEKRTYHKSI